MSRPCNMHRPVTARMWCCFNRPLQSHAAGVDGPPMSIDRPAGDESNPVLRRTTIRPGGSTEPGDAVFFANRLTTLTHELTNLLDGSMRCLMKVQRSIGPGTGGPAEPVNNELESVYAAMEQMASILRCAMPSTSPALGSADAPRLGWRGSLTDSIEHAAEVMRAVAIERSVTITTDIDRALEDIPAGPVFSIVANAIRNSIESIGRATGSQSGSIQIIAGLERNSNGQQTVTIDILDDGLGLPLPVAKSPARAFEFGYSTKPGGGGIGLALARDLVDALAGELVLVTRDDLADPVRPGAQLSLRYPVPTVESLGNEASAA